MPFDPPSVDICNCMALRKAARHVTNLYDRVLGPAGLTASQYGILAELDRSGGEGISLQRLSAKLIIERSALARNLKALECCSWIRVVSPPTDRRQRLVTLTGDGKGRLGIAKPLWRSAQQRFEAVVGEGESRQLRQLAALAKTASFA